MWVRSLVRELRSHLLSDMAKLWQPRGVGWSGRWERGSRGRDICISMADSCWCMTETNTILWSNYLSIKNKLKNFSKTQNPESKTMCSTTTTENLVSNQVQAAFCHCSPCPISFAHNYSLVLEKCMFFNAFLLLAKLLILPGCNSLLSWLHLQLLLQDPA